MLSLDFEKAGAKVIGVSPDNVTSHEKFIEKYDLPFTLLADTEKKVCEALASGKRRTCTARSTMGVVRTTFLIDARGMVRQIFPKVKVDGHADAVLEALKARSELEYHGSRIFRPGGSPGPAFVLP